MRILVAGIGNIFFGDDAFGVEVIRALQERAIPPEVYLEDFGIRSYDLAYALMDGYDVVILVDATPRGQTPGTVSLIEPLLDGLDDAPMDITNAHGLNPATVLQMVQTMGGHMGRLYLVGCEPRVLESDDLVLSPPVQAAIPQAVEMILSLVDTLLADAPVVPSSTVSPKEVNLS